MPQHLLLFAANGAIGSEVASLFAGKGWRVTGTSRQSAEGVIAYQPGDPGAVERLIAHAPFDAVCWAQGANLSDSVYDVAADKHLALYEANCLFILQSLQSLLAAGALAKGAKLAVISSIWQEMARQNKLSYSMTKAALAGLVHSASIDLGRDGYLINAVLPGVLDTPMTRANLTPAQVQTCEAATPTRKLATTGDIAGLVYFLCSDANRNITGQSLTVDGGFSHARVL